MITYYFAVRMRQMADGTNDFTLSSAKESITEAESMVSCNISADMKNAGVLAATNLVLGSDGSIGTKKYFTHNRDAENAIYYEIEIAQYTEESGKDMYKAYHDYSTEFEAEAQFWQEMGNGKKNVDIDGLMNIVLNWHGGAEIKDYWIQYPEEPTESEG